MPVKSAVMVSDGSRNHVTARLLEEAMGAAASKALADGITDPAETKKLMLAAREKLKAQLSKKTDKKG